MKDKKRKKTYKSSPLFLLFYLCMVIGLGYGIGRLWCYVWNAAAEFQTTRPETLMEAEALRIAKEGAFFRRNYEKDGMVYTVFSAEGDDCADVEILTKEETGFLGFALYETGKATGRKSAKAEALEGISVFFDGEKMEPTAKRELSGPQVPEEFAKLPAICTYEADGYFRTPVIRAEGVAASAEGQDFYAFGYTEEEKTELLDFAKAFLTDYSYYLIGELDWSSMSNYLILNTPLRKRLSGFYDSWYTNYVESSFGEISVSDIVRFSDTLWSFDSRFDYSVRGKWKTTNYSVDVHCYALKTENGYKMLEMTNN